MTDRLRVSTRTARSKGYARINNNPAFYAGMVFAAGSILMAVSVPALPDARGSLL